MSTPSLAALMTATVFVVVAFILVIVVGCMSMIMSDSIVARICGWLLLISFLVGVIYAASYLLVLTGAS